MNHRTRVYDSILELASNADNPTPIVRLRRVVPFKHAQVWAKLEWYNPFGSVKDRVAANMIRDAEEHRRLAPGTRLVEPTSGNTGMGLALLANAKGYRFTATLSNKIPAEKRASLRVFGTEVVELEDDLCPAPGAPEGAIALAAKLGDDPGNFHLNQYKNPANPDAHFRTTGPEVWRQTEGTITHFVAGLGTCGTLTGTGRFLKKQRADVRVLGVHPADGHDIPGVRSLRQLQQTALFSPSEYDGLVEISNGEAYELCRRLNQEESIVAGPSSAMALAGAFKTVPDEPGVVCVVLFPDNVFKYTSSMKKHLPQMFAGQKPEGAGLPSSLEKIVEFARSSPDVLEPAVVKTALEGPHPPTLVDVRSIDEYAKERIDGALSVPLTDLAADHPTVLPDDKSAPLVTVCKVGERSLVAMLLLKSKGYQNVKNLSGGVRAWAAAGFSLETG